MLRRLAAVLRGRHAPAAALFPAEPTTVVDEADRALLERFARDPPPPGEAGFVIDFLGVRTRVEFLGAGGRAFSGEVTGVPIPNDFRAHTPEWVGLIRAVAAARGRFVAMELGAGWAPWLVAGAIAAARRGIGRVTLCGVEAEPGHFTFLRQHFQDNGLDPDAHRLIEAAIGPEDGEALWPETDDPAEDYGGRVLSPGETIDHRGRPARVRRVRMVGFAGLLREEEAWDFVHLDVQGAEAALAAAAGEAIARRVRRLVIGTHTRRIEGELLEAFHHLGFALEHESPARFAYDLAAPSVLAMTRVDGTQIWRNPRLVPDP